MMRILGLLLILVLSLLCLFMLLFTAVCLCACRGRRARPADAILILGAKVHPDGSMSKALLFRCERALELYRAGVSRYIIACGGVCGGLVSEAFAIRAFLVENGVPEDCILLEDRSVNTWQNLINARAIMDAHGFRRVLLVTSDYHLTRALWMARKQGLNAHGAASRSSRKPSHFLRTRFRESVSWILYAYNEIKKTVAR